MLRDLLLMSNICITQFLAWKVIFGPNIADSDLEYVMQSLKICFSSDRNTLRVMSIFLHAMFDRWVERGHKIIDQNYPKTSKKVSEALFLFNFSSVRVQERMDPLRIPESLLSVYSCNIIKWGISTVNPNTLTFSSQQNLIKSCFTASRDLLFHEAFTDFVLIQFKPKPLILTCVLNFATNNLYLNSLLGHLNHRELIYIKKRTHLDAGIQHAIRQVIAIKLSPIISELEFGNLNMALHLLLQPETVAQDIAESDPEDNGQENNAQEDPVVQEIIEDDVPLPQLEQIANPVPPLPPAPRFPDSNSESGYDGDDGFDGYDGF